MKDWGLWVSPSEWQKVGDAAPVAGGKADLASRGFVLVVPRCCVVTMLGGRRWI